MGKWLILLLVLGLGLSAVVYRLVLTRIIVAPGPQTTEVVAARAGLAATIPPGMRMVAIRVDDVCCRAMGIWIGASRYWLPSPL